MKKSSPLLGPQPLPRYCVECYWYWPPTLAFHWNGCLNPELQDAPDLVTKTSAPASYEEARRPGATCGPDGALYEAKRAPGFTWH